ncbi:MAG: DUF177 domain-containing protein [Pseudomonadota bacterium]
MPVAQLRATKSIDIDLSPDEETRQAIVRFLGLNSLARMRLKGEIGPIGQDAWRFTGRLTSDVAQPCVVSLEDVAQKIDVSLDRTFLPLEDADETAELDLDPDGDDPDFFEDAIDLGALAVETLALALEPYPRTKGAELEQDTAMPPGSEPLDDEAAKPFAALNKLRDKLQP